MINFDTYKEIQELLKLGVKQTKICEKLNISKMQLMRYGLLPEDLFLKTLQSRTDYTFETYRDYIISLLKVTPDLNDTAVLYRVKEEFEDFDISRNTFFRHLKNLRQETGYVNNRITMERLKADSLPGYEAQADFGQYKMTDMYGKNLRVYFFVLILSYSRMRFCYFSRDPFTTETAIKAHEYAFRYFGGRPQTILYDQDKVFIVNDNFGDFILTSKFEEYVRETGFQARFCHKHDPHSKGKIENTVLYIKTGFLNGKIYEGIDVLNSSCLEWLDRFANGDYNSITKKIPREVFKEESKALTKVKTYIKQTTFILTVGRDNSIKYKGNRYVVNPLLHLSGCRVKIVVDDNKMKVYRAVGDEFIAEYDLIVGEGYINTCKKVTEKASIYPKIINNIFGQDKNVEKFIEAMKKLQPDYFIKQTRRFVRMTRFYTKDELYEAIMYCLKKKKETIMELSSYLIYKYGQDRGKMYLKFQELYQYTRRSKEIKEEIENARCKRNKGNG